jgi:hypothetical protein
MIYETPAPTHSYRNSCSDVAKRDKSSTNRLLIWAEYKYILICCRTGCIKQVEGLEKIKRNEANVKGNNGGRK